MRLIPGGDIVTCRNEGVVALCAIFTLLSPTPAWAEVHRILFVSGNRYLHVEVLSDGLIHFETSAVLPAPPIDEPIRTTPMVLRTDFPGPTSFTDDGNGVLETASLRITVDPATLCVSVVDRTRQPEFELTTLCPFDQQPDIRGLTIAPAGMRNVYGLGEQFNYPALPNGDWAGRTRAPGNSFGNAIVGFSGGGVGNAQFPIMYALGDASEHYALFVDGIRAQGWLFNRTPWEMRTRGDALRWYLLSGPSLPAVRQSYMDLVGRPPVPPKQMLGLWVSEYGYDDWAELDDKLASLRANEFPVDGFILDLQWYGGVERYVEWSRMGGLNWDTTAFPNPTQKIADLAAAQGIGIMPIEESYVSRQLTENAVLHDAGYLVRYCASCDQIYLYEWWGAGGMIDWTNPAGADFWHDWKRQPLIDAGVLGHWTDLGEPENFSPDGWYHGLPEFGWNTQTDLHNLYNLLWLDSIHRGYDRNGVTRRPFMLSRSGTAGIQRFGASMWSGDIGSNLPSLAAHLNAQMHMSFSGMDYFISDIGGFLRGSLDGDLDEMYTIWFAHGMAFDIPGRPHTENLCNCHETAPDRVGDLASNRANLRQRYELTPYLYSLAHRAYLYGEPVIPPLVYYFPADPVVRAMGDEKLIGPSLLAATVTTYGQSTRDVYLPAGTWIDHHSNAWVESSGQWVAGVPLYRDGHFKLPVFAQAGAILPQMFVDEKTMNVTGRRTDGTTCDELIVRVYAAESPTGFTLFEDDGATIAYQSGAVRTTEITQQRTALAATVVIGAASGTYAGAPTMRDNVVALVAREHELASAVKLDDTSLPQLLTKAEFDAAASGWHNAAGNLILAKSGPAPTSASKTFVFTIFDETVPRPGDLNCDGLIDFADINPMVLHLSSFAAWQATYPSCPPQNGDIDGDGTYGQGAFGDINPFVDLISGGG